MTLKFMNLEGLERNFQPWKQTRKRVLLKLTLSVKTTHFYQQVYRLLPLFPYQIFPWKWDRGNVWPPINGVIWLDFIIVASLCYKTWISLKKIFFKKIHYEIRNTVRYGTIYPRLFLRCPREKIMNSETGS